jgi:U3 small nucleolar ribonucleoprotein protein IMP4
MCQSNLKIIITTSRNPSSSLLKFTKELKKIFPFSLRVNRGNKFLKSLISYCLIENATDLLLVYENRGVPSSLIISHLPSGPTVFFRLSNIILNKIGKKEKIPRNFPLIVIDNLNSPLGKRLSSILRNLFPIPCTNSKNVVIFSGNNNVITCKNYWFERKGNFKSDILLHQTPPSFDMFPFKISLGVLFEKREEIEWSTNTFTNTFKKKSFFN